MNVEAKGVEVGQHTVYPDDWKDPEQALHDYNQHQGYILRAQFRLDKGAYPQGVRDLLKERIRDAEKIIGMIKEAVPEIEQLSEKNTKGIIREREEMEKERRGSDSHTF